MMGTRPSRPPATSRTGLWSTVSSAINGGWGTTARMLVILLALGTIAIGLALAVGGGLGGMALRSLLTLL